MAVLSQYIAQIQEWIVAATKSAETPVLQGMWEGFWYVSAWQQSLCTEKLPLKMAKDSQNINVEWYK
jgi:hypothetical protein